MPGSIEVSKLQRVIAHQTDGVNYIKYYNAYTLSDVYCIVGNVIPEVANITLGQSLWFRGQSFEKYNLVPSLFRGNGAEINGNKTYSTLSLREDYRYQSFNSRVNHLIHTAPESRIEWQELLQHHFGSTRLMDWTESARIALDFALEPYIDTKRDRWRYLMDENITPNIWVLNPFALNKKVYDFFSNNIEFIEKALSEFALTPHTRKQMATELQNALNAGFNVYGRSSQNGEKDISIDGLISVCTLDKYRSFLSSDLQTRLATGEFNPYFYLILRFYADALPVEVGVNNKILPPLAALQPYHSERIRTQRGAFTIFPNYFMNTDAQKMNAINMNLLAIEAQTDLNDCLYCIRLCNPVQITKDLLYSGERRSELYPDVQAYAELIEANSFVV